MNKTQGGLSPVKPCSVSLRDEEKAVLQILGRGNVSAGIRALIDRLEEEVYNEIMEETDRARKREEKLKKFRQTESAKKALEESEALSKKRRRLLNKKKRKSNSR